VSYLVDTNVISELRKQDRSNPGVRAWFATVADDDLYLSVLVIGEIQQGIDRARSHDSGKAEALEKWLSQVRHAFGSRIRPVTISVADEWGRRNGIRPLPAVDSMLAATATVNGLTLVTRNVDDIVDTGVSYLNPFEGRLD
jgi:predicted nucleic acid-binding protein